MIRWEAARRGAGLRAGLAAFLLALGFFSAGALLRDPWRTDEHRYLEIAREMALPGASWLVPHLGGHVYTDKPPGYFWAAAALHRAGVPLPEAGLLASALAAALTVALLFDVARRAGGLRLGAAAALALASSQLALSLALRANLDALLTACTTLAVHAYLRAELRARAGEPALPAALLAGAAAAAACLVKGPVGILVPGVAALGHRILERGRCRLPRRALALAGVAAFALPGLWVLAAVGEAGWPYARDLVLGNGVAHPLGQVDKLRPPAYYLRVLPTVFAPWIVLLPAGLVWAWRRRGELPASLALAWVLPGLAVLSASPAKRHLYLAPLVPGLALLVAPVLEALARRAGLGEEGPVARRLARAGAALTATASLGLGLTLVAGVGLTLFAPHLFGRWAPEPVAALPELLPWLPAAAAAVGAGLLACGVELLRPEPRTDRFARVAAVCLAAGLFQAILLHPAESVLRSPVPFYRAVRPLLGGAEVAIYGRLDFSPHWALERTDVGTLEAQPASPPKGSAPTDRPWLIAEGPELDRLGWPAGYHPAFVAERHRDAALLLLAPTPGGAREAGQPAPPAHEAAGPGRSAFRRPLPEVLSGR